MVTMILAGACLAGILILAVKSVDMEIQQTERELERWERDLKASSRSTESLRFRKTTPFEVHMSLPANPHAIIEPE